MMTLCPLCLNRSSFTEIKGPDKRTYLCCDKCKLVFTSTSFKPSRKEKEKRDKMQNDGVKNQEYVNILNQLIEPILPFLSPEMNGLDYGCSSEPALSILLKKRGLKCQDYNPGNSTLIENETFDYIFVNNCLSEFFLPAKELQKINNLLKPDGYLIIANEKWTTPEAFTRLSHAKDNTHVTFYHTNTFRYIAEKYKLSIIESNNPRIVLMKKGKSDIELKDVKPKSELELV